MTSSALRATDSFQLTEHALGMARQRGVALSELSNVLADRSFVINNSRKDPGGDQYVLRYKDLRIVWREQGEKIVVLTIFHR